MKGSFPHILLLVTDQFRFDVVSPEVTPNIYHRLQQSSGTTTFSHAYTSTPVCTPARAALLTGKSPWAHGLLAYAKYTDCDRYATTLPRMLRLFRNYHMTVVGKNHFGPVKHVQGYQDETLYEGLSPDGVPLIDDYVVWFNESMPNMDPLATCQLHWNYWEACPYYYDEFYHPTSWTTRNAVDYLKDYFEEDSVQDHQQPLLLKVSYHRPHSPYDPPRRFLDQYLEGGPKSNIPQLNRFVNDSSWDRNFKDIPMNADAWAGDPGPEKARHTRAGYLGNVEFVDEGVGQILDFIESNNLQDQFMIIWTSDHGDQNGDHYLWRKGYPWESNAHIPFVIKLASNNNKPLPPPQISDAVVENRDVAPTIYDMIGILDQVKGLDPLMDGKSLLPILNRDDKISSVREWVDMELYAYNKTNHWNALVGYLTNNTYCDYWKYIFNAFDGSDHLFCLSKDPNETHDLASLYTDVTATWRQRMILQFETEGRGEHWIKNGVLQVRETNVLYGDNFPCRGNDDEESPSLVRKE